jgi:hypothetical protein
VVGVEGGCSAGSGPVLQEGAEVLCGMDGLPVPAQIGVEGDVVDGHVGGSEVQVPGSGQLAGGYGQGLGLGEAPLPIAITCYRTIAPGPEPAEAGDGG